MCMCVLTQPLQIAWPQISFSTKSYCRYSTMHMSFTTLTYHITVLNSVYSTVILNMSTKLHCTQWTNTCWFPLLFIIQMRMNATKQYKPNTFTSIWKCACHMHHVKYWIYNVVIHLIESVWSVHIYNNINGNSEWI